MALTNTQRKQDSQKNQTKEKHDLERLKDRERKKIKRQNETSEAKKSRLSKQNARQIESRDKEGKAAHNLRKVKQVLRQRRLRKKQKESKSSATLEFGSKDVIANEKSDEKDPFLPKPYKFSRAPVRVNIEDLENYSSDEDAEYKCKLPKNFNMDLKKKQPERMCKNMSSSPKN